MQKPLKFRKVTDGWIDGQTDLQTDGPTRQGIVACPQLKMIKGFIELIGSIKVTTGRGTEI